MYNINNTVITNEKLQKSIDTILEKRLEALERIRKAEEQRHQQIVADFLDELGKEVQAHPEYKSYKIKTLEPQLINWLHLYAKNTNVEYECTPGNDYSLSIIVNIR